ncbi:hypothetical protein ADUPG1_010533 [Aduncisulcus paluster]|uniref:Uncharacterized protein n=1 Tax=Aduncisulcus paluster TaxID=2918883 RepID=A0ABQ5JUP9_9EUKA|nr:hypothetical protein ADUPG1_010533 [Aduncisulcus paluster]
MLSFQYSSPKTFVSLSREDDDLERLLSEAEIDKELEESHLRSRIRNADRDVHTRRIRSEMQKLMGKLSIQEKEFARKLRYAEEMQCVPDNMIQMIKRIDSIPVEVEASTHMKDRALHRKTLLDESQSEFIKHNYYHLNCILRRISHYREILSKYEKEKSKRIGLRDLLSSEEPIAEKPRKIEFDEIIQGKECLERFEELQDLKLRHIDKSRKYSELMSQIISKYRKIDSSSTILSSIEEYTELFGKYMGEKVNEIIQNIIQQK